MIFLELKQNNHAINTYLFRKESFMNIENCKNNGDYKKEYLNFVIHVSVVGEFSCLTKSILSLFITI